MAVSDVAVAMHTGSEISESLARHVKPVLIPETKIVNDRVFPLVLSPVNAKAGAADRMAMLRDHHAEVLGLVRTHGAVILRGWGPTGASHFSELVGSLGLDATEMACSAGPRFVAAKNVFTANGMQRAQHQSAAPRARVMRLICASPAPHLRAPAPRSRRGAAVRAHPLPPRDGAVRRAALARRLLLRDGGAEWWRDAHPAVAPRRDVPAQVAPRGRRGTLRAPSWLGR